MAEHSASGAVNIPAATVSGDSGSFDRDKLDEIIQLLYVLIAKCRL